MYILTSLLSLILKIHHVPIFLTALANVLENTALFGDILLRLPDITHEVIKNKRSDFILKC